MVVYGYSFTLSENVDALFYSYSVEKWVTQKMLLETTNFPSSSMRQLGKSWWKKRRFKCEYLIYLTDTLQGRKVDLTHMMI